MMIEMSNLCKTYHTRYGEVQALRNIDFLVENGEFVSVIGRSGSGKSTLMNILGCLDVPSKGSYLLNGGNVLQYSEKKLSAVRNQTIGFVFQGFHLISDLTALENVELPLIYRGLGKKERRKCALRALEAVGLQDRILHRPHELSGGQQQRVAIARAVAATPSLLLADEPTGNLDSKSGNEILQIIRELHHKGCTVVLITHDERVAKAADRTVEMNNGFIYV